MLSILPSVRIYFCMEPVDMRKSFDGLEHLAREIVEAEPMAGHLFVFRNRRGDRVKILHWDRTGYVIWYKLLERGTFELPATDGRSAVQLDPRELLLILEGIDLGSARSRRRWTQPARRPA